MELFNPVTGLTCSLPDLPDRRGAHTMSGLTVCGGYHTKTTCLVFSQGQWSASHTLAQERYYHSSWRTQEATLLIGGEGSVRTSELVTKGESFTLVFDTE